MSETTHEHGVVTTNVAGTQLHVMTRIKRAANCEPEVTVEIETVTGLGARMVRLDLCRAKALRQKLDTAIEAGENTEPTVSRKR